MITLHTRDGSRIGNAIIYGTETSELSGDFLFLIETDFGNKLKLNAKEVDEWFSLGRPVSYAEWQTDRQAKREEPE